MISVVTSMTMQGQKKSVVESGAEVEDARLRKELEDDESTEFDMITAELKEMGMDEDDVEDLKHLAEMMHEFLDQIPSLAEKLELRKDYDLLDNVQLYLLGLPNKLGPLGYIALHNVLEELDDADGEIV